MRSQRVALSEFATPNFEGKAVKTKNMFGKLKHHFDLDSARPGTSLKIIFEY